MSVLDKEEIQRKYGTSYKVVNVDLSPKNSNGKSSDLTFEKIFDALFNVRIVETPGEWFYQSIQEAQESFLFLREVLVREIFGKEDYCSAYSNLSPAKYRNGYLSSPEGFISNYKKPTVYTSQSLFYSEQSGHINLGDVFKVLAEESSRFGRSLAKLRDIADPTFTIETLDTLNIDVSDVSFGLGNKLYVAFREASEKFAHIQEYKVERVMFEHPDAEKDLKASRTAFWLSKFTPQIGIIDDGEKLRLDYDNWGGQREAFWSRDRKSLEAQMEDGQISIVPFEQTRQTLTPR